MALAVNLRIGDTGAQDVVLSSGGIFITDYPMTAPDVDQQTLNSLGDGQSLSVPAFANVTESIDLHIGGPGYTAAQVRDMVRSIEKLLDMARQGSLGWLDDRLYLLVQFDQDTEPWRSQILAAKWDSPEATDQIWKNYTTGTITLTRRYYFETAAHTRHCADQWRSHRTHDL